MYLWTIDHSGFHFVKDLRSMMYDDEVRAKYMVAWMSHTKLAFVHYYSMDYGHLPPRVIVHHYW